MSFLSSLARAYDRLPDAPPFGYSMQNIGFVISLNEDGSVAGVHDWREGDGKKARPRPELVPQPVKRTAGIAPNFLWDKTSYVLGITEGEGKRTAEEHKAFKDRHLEAIGEDDDPGLKALAAFLMSWKAEDFRPPFWPEAMRDQNIVFALESERLSRFLHRRPAAQALWSRLSDSEGADNRICLVTGQSGPIARLHPSIKGVWGAQSSGAALVSFNLEAFTSYGHEQGENAPVSEAAAFAYTTVLNRFLERDSSHRIQIGDSSTVFWADASNVDFARQAEALAREMFDEATEEVEKAARREIRVKLERIKKGASLEEIEPELVEGVDFFVLGLSPNAARISIRFYWQGSFGQLTDNYRHYMRDIAFWPWPEDKPQPTFRQCVARLGAARIDKNGRVSFDQKLIPDQFAGEFTRAAIVGCSFPSGLLGHLLMRIRSDRFLDAVRVSMIKAILTREARLYGRLPLQPDGQTDKDYLMKPDPDDPSLARRLGRIFALMERIQAASLGEGVNANIKDKFLSAGAATPQQVFSSLIKLTEAHLSRLRRGHSDAEWIASAAIKANIGTGEMARRIGSALGAQMGKLIASVPEEFPSQHDQREQGLFMIGYYQERYGRKGEAAAPSEADLEIDVLPDTDEE